MAATMYYESFTGLTEPPFSISPDPRYFFMTHSHREALAHLSRGVESNAAAILLTGEDGTGKTSVCQYFLRHLPEKTDVAYIFSPPDNPLEFLQTICTELGISSAGEKHKSIKGYTDLIYLTLVVANSQGRNTVLLIDEAENLSTDVLESLCLLNNLEIQEKKLLQLFLVGQPELEKKLASPAWARLDKIISARFHLEVLEKNDLPVYIQHRLKVAGAKEEIFTEEAYESIWRYSKGIPKTINILCDLSLLGGFVKEADVVNLPIVEDAAKEVFGEKKDSPTEPKQDSKSLLPKGFALAVGLCLLIIAGVYVNRQMVTQHVNISSIDSITTTLPQQPTTDDSAQNKVPHPPLQNDNLIQTTEALAISNDIVNIDDTEHPPETISPEPAETDANENNAETIIPPKEKKNTVANHNGTVTTQPFAVNDNNHYSASDNSASGKFADSIPTGYNGRKESIPPSSEGIPDEIQRDETMVEEVSDLGSVNLLVDMPLSDLEQTAYVNLFKQWGIDPLPANNIEPCKFAESVGLGCLNRRGYFSALKLLDRPATLSLHDEHDRTYQVTLVEITENKAKITLGNRTIHLPLEELDSHWHDNFIVLWEKPPGYRFPIRVGRKDEFIGWLAEQFDIEPDPLGDKEYTPEIEEHVKDVQRSAGLKPDGVVGPLTIIAINNQSGANVPRLYKSLKE